MNCLLPSSSIKLAVAKGLLSEHYKESKWIFKRNPKTSLYSKWFFVTITGRKIYMHLGCNHFGKSPSNSIIIQNKACDLLEFCVKCPDQNTQPTIRDLSGKIYFNEEKLDGLSKTLKNGCRVELMVPRGLLYMQFFYDDTVPMNVGSGIADINQSQFNTVIKEGRTADIINDGGMRQSATVDFPLPLIDPYTGIYEAGINKGFCYYHKCYYCPCKHSTFSNESVNFGASGASNGTIAINELTDSNIPPLAKYNGFGGNNLSVGNNVIANEFNFNPPIFSEGTLDNSVKISTYNFLLPLIHPQVPPTEVYDAAPNEEYCPQHDFYNCPCNDFIFSNESVDFGLSDASNVTIASYEPENFNCSSVLMHGLTENNTFIENNATNGEHNMGFAAPYSDTTVAKTAAIFKENVAAFSDESNAFSPGYFGKSGHASKFLIDNGYDANISDLLL